MSGRKTAAQLRAEGAKRERAAVLALFHRQMTDIQSLVAQGKLRAETADPLCLRLTTISEQVAIGLHVREVSVD